MTPTLSRLSRQAAAFEVIERQFFYTEDDLSAVFKQQVGDRLRPGVRGFGYWAWKPEVVLMAIDQIDFGELLCYCDAGFHLNSDGESHLDRYLRPLVKQETDLVAFTHEIGIAEFQGEAADLPDFPEYKYTKGDMLDFFRIRKYPQFTHTPQYASGLFFMRKTQANIGRLKHWKETALKMPQLFDDSPSVSSNFPGFVENRHDQSYFSLMCKKADHRAFSAFEFWYPAKSGLKADWGAIAKFPFHAKRDKQFCGFRRYWQPFFVLYWRAKTWLKS